MSEMECLTAHHEEFTVMITQIRVLLGSENIESAADEVMELISHLNGQLMVHLTMEDRHVYPALLACEDDNVRETATKLRGEIGHLFGEFQKYRLKWTCATQVCLDPEAFLKDTESIFSIINKRMVMEDDLLYPEVMGLNLC